MRRLSRPFGFTLVEVIVIIIILGVLASVATQKVSVGMETARYEQTKRELDELARAIVGNPETYGKGSRSDFGYVGDVGSLPASLDALTQNPGSYSTWKGPYIERGFGSTDFKNDAWGVPYTYAGTTLRSTGSGSSIDKLFSASSAVLLSNLVQGVVLDANQHIPGAVYKDSLRVRLSYPNGTGGTTIADTMPTGHGLFSFTGVPIGVHELKLIYLPDSDTVTVPITVYPNRTAKIEVILPANVW